MERLTWHRPKDGAACPRAPKDASAEYILGEFYAKVLDRLAYYEDMEEQGRLVVLPCEPDAIVWLMLGDIPAVTRFDGQCVLDNDGNLFYKLEGDDINASQIGKTVFLTRESAENALKGGAN